MYRCFPLISLVTLDPNAHRNEYSSFSDPIITRLKPYIVLLEFYGPRHICPRDESLQSILDVVQTSVSLIDEISVCPQRVGLRISLCREHAQNFPLVVIPRPLVLKDDSLTIESFVNPKVTVDLFVFGH